MGFYGNLIHKYKKNEITIPKNTICSVAIYLINYIQILNLNKKNHKYHRIFKFYYHIYQNMPKTDDITTYSQSDFKKIYKCEICDIAMIVL